MTISCIIVLFPFFIRAQTAKIKIDVNRMIGQIDSKSMACLWSLFRLAVGGYTFKMYSDNGLESSGNTCNTERYAGFI